MDPDQDISANYFLKVHLLYIFLKIKSQKEVTKQKESRFFILFLLDDRRIRIRTSDQRIRIQEVQKHMDPTDPDPQDCVPYKPSCSD
jgi:hypothetical protein